MPMRPVPSAPSPIRAGVVGLAQLQALAARLTCLPPKPQVWCRPCRPRNWCKRSGCRVGRTAIDTTPVCAHKLVVLCLNLFTRLGKIALGRVLRRATGGAVPVAVAQQAQRAALGAVPKHFVIGFLFGHGAFRVASSQDLLERDYGVLSCVAATRQRLGAAQGWEMTSRAANAMERKSALCRLPRYS